MKSDNEIEQDWQKFLELLLKCKKREDLEQFLNLFMTLEEKRDMVNRYCIIRELVKGEKTQREIAKDLKVSIAKITRGSNFLKTIPQEFYKYIKNKLG